MSYEVLEEFAYDTNQKQDVAKLLKLLNKYLLMVTFEKGNKLFDSVRTGCRKTAETT